MPENHILFEKQKNQFSTVLILCSITALVVAETLNTLTAYKVAVPLLISKNKYATDTSLLHWSPWEYVYVLTAQKKASTPLNSIKYIIVGEMEWALY